MTECDSLSRDFSEDEEAAFVASQSEDVSVDIDLTSGNVVSVESERQKERSEKRALLRPLDGSPYKPQGDRPLILFDLNGVLVHHRFDGKSHIHTLRPGVNQLLRLKEYFDLGIYSSATERTVKFALMRLERGLGTEGQGLFDVVLHREHCLLASDAGCLREDGKPWDTVKPLEIYFGDHQVALVDDSSHKSFPGEERSMVVLPTWEDDDDGSRPGCEVLKLLTDMFMEYRYGDGSLSEIVDRARNTAFERMVTRTRNAEILEVLDVLNSDSDEEGAVLPVFDDRGDLNRIEETDGPGPSSPHPPGSTGEGPTKRQKTAHGPGFSSLHRELECFLHEASPTDYELLRVEHLMGVINECTAQLWPGGRALLFGSQAQGLALPGADLDITIQGVLRFQKARANTGYAPWQKAEIKALLEQLLGKLMEAGVVDERAEIILARIPVLKFNAIIPAGGEKIPVDISMGTSNGISAMQFLRANIVKMAPLRPIVLFLKCLLREANLSEVFTGGLGSYALINMVMARLQHWGYQPVLMDESCTVLNAVWNEYRRNQVSQFSMNTEDSSMSMDFVKHLRDYNAKSIQERRIDLGVLLWDFLLYFGNVFDYHRDAVSVLSGGVRRKGTLFDRKCPLNLVVEDPQEPGKDISRGTFDIKLVQELFKEVEKQLAAHCELYSEVESGNRRLSEGSILKEVIDVTLALDRGDSGIQARERHSHLKIQKAERLFGASTNSTKYSVAGRVRQPRRHLEPENTRRPTTTSLGVQKNFTKPAKKAKRRFYAVSRGRQTGIYDDAEAACAQTRGYRGARSRSFKSLAEAEVFLREEAPGASLAVHTSHGKCNAAPASLKEGKSPRLRGSKVSRAVAQQWKGKNRSKGQHFDGE